MISKKLKENCLLLQAQSSSQQHSKVHIRQNSTANFDHP